MTPRLVASLGVGPPGITLVRPLLVGESLYAVDALFVSQYLMELRSSLSCPNAQ